MDSELPDLESRAAVDEMESRTANSLAGMLLGIAVVSPWLLFVGSVMSGNFLWLTVLNLIGAHVGLLVMLCGYRDDNRILKRWGAVIHVISLLLCLTVLAILR